MTLLLGGRTLKRNHTESSLDVYAMLTSFHSAKGCLLSMFLWRNVINSTAVNLMSPLAFLVRYVHWCNNGLKVMGKTNCFPIELSFTGRNSCLLL